MALVRCSECGSEISSSATKCPKCGKGRVTPGSVARTVVRLVLAVLVAIAAVVLFVIGRLQHLW
jgi:hypothetical protein